jgi:hypothetical protein
VPNPSKREKPSLWDALKVSTVVRRYAVRSMDALGHPPLMADSADGAGIRTLIVGRDPIRVLLFGGGLAVSYGVTTRDEALDGHLARLIAEQTGRGVIIENRAVKHVAVGDAVKSLGATGALTYAVAFWSPSFADATRLRSLKGWREALDDMVEQMRAETEIPLLLACMPIPLGSYPAAILGRPFALRLNRVITDVAARHAQVIAVESAPFIAREVGAPVTGPGYFRDLAEGIAPALLRLLGETARQPAQVGLTP